MKDVIMTLDVFLNEYGRFEGRNEEIILQHDETFRIRGGNVFDKYKKILLIFRDSHVHLYYRISLDDIRKFEEQNKIEIRFALTTKYYFDNGGVQINNSIFVLIECVVNILEKFVSKIEPINNLSAVLSSDPHGDLIAFLIPLCLSRNFRIRRINKNIVEADFLQGIPCVIDGDFYYQKADYFSSWRSMARAQNKLTKLQKKIDVEFGICLQNLIISTLWFIIIGSLSHFCNVWFLLGNHDSEIFDFEQIQVSKTNIKLRPFHEQLFILLLLEVRDRVYVVQHGLFNMKIHDFGRCGFRQEPDDDIMKAVYECRKRQSLRRFNDIRITGISYLAIREKIDLMDEKYLFDKVVEKIKQQARNETHLKSMETALLCHKFRPLGIEDLYHSKSQFDFVFFNKLFNNFLRDITPHQYIKAFLVLGHSSDYNLLPLETENNTEKLTDIKKIKLSNDVSMNILGLDTKSNSFMNEFVFQSALSLINKKGGSWSQKGSSIVKIIIFTFLLIICLVILLICFTTEKTSPIFINTITHST